MYAKTLLTVLMLSTLAAAGCASGAADDTESADGALSGTPGAATDEEARTRAAALKAKLYEGYRAATLSGMGEVSANSFPCLKAAPGSRTFFWHITAAAVQSASSEAVGTLRSELTRQDLDTVVMIVQSPADSYGKSSLAFYTYSNGNAEICSGSSLGVAPATLRCDGVDEKSGPAKEQCGL